MMPIQCNRKRGAEVRFLNQEFRAVLVRRSAAIQP